MKPRAWVSSTCRAKARQKSGGTARSSRISKPSLRGENAWKRRPWGGAHLSDFSSVYRPDCILLFRAHLGLGINLAFYTELREDTFPTGSVIAARFSDRRNIHKEASRGKSSSQDCRLAIASGRCRVDRGLLQVCSLHGVTPESLGLSRLTIGPVSLPEIPAAWPVLP